MAFLKLGSTSDGLVGVSGIFFESQDNQILAFQCVRVLTCSWEVSAYHDKSIPSFLTCSV